MEASKAERTVHGQYSSSPRIAFHVMYKWFPNTRNHVFIVHSPSSSRKFQEAQVWQNTRIPAFQ